MEENVMNLWGCSNCIRTYFYLYFLFFFYFSLFSSFIEHKTSTLSDKIFHSTLLLPLFAFWIILFAFSGSCDKYISLFADLFEAYCLLTRNKTSLAGRYNLISAHLRVCFRTESSGTPLREHERGFWGKNVLSSCFTSDYALLSQIEIGKRVWWCSWMEKLQFRMLRE